MSTIDLASASVTTIDTKEFWSWHFYEWFTILIILKNNIRVDLMNHNPPPFGASVLVGTERFPYPYKKCLVSLSNRCEISQSTSLVRRGFHKKCFVPISNRCGISQSTLMAQRDFYTLIRNVWFSSPTNVGSHTSPPSGPSVLADIEEFPHPYKECMVPLPN